MKFFLQHNLYAFILMWIDHKRWRNLCLQYTHKKGLLKKQSGRTKLE